MKIKAIYLLSLLAICLPIAAEAQSGKNTGKKVGKGASPEAVLARLDADENGSLSKDEVRGRMLKHFESIDANSDGTIRLEELTAAREKTRERVGKKVEKIRDADTDGNRAISIDEAANAGMDKLVKNFEFVDIDGDGEISREEMRTFRKARQNRKGANK
ncbi:MAG: hypothetical protein GVY36_12345 [Verrucomicrobia bacterium]|jgi:Ca2+-binding EF-hand superfamily protein|nr:hypothetical protein [Verrucomicrobiota bacterium]